MAGLVARGISKDFGGVRALKDVSLTLDRGQIVGLIGPNGSGKTTLLNVISGVFRPEAGTVELDGTAITGLAAHRIAEAGIARTFQNIRLFEDLTALENVQVGAVASYGRIARGGRRIALAALEETGLGEAAYQRPKSLAYGAQRRLEMARALASKPHYLLLDEPAAGMNEAESDDLLASIAATVERLGLGLLIIDHDLRLIMRLCHRVVVLNSGEVIAEGTPSEVQANRSVAEAYLGRRHAHTEPSKATSGEGVSSENGIRATYRPKPDLGDVDRGREGRERGTAKEGGS